MSKRVKSSRPKSSAGKAGAGADDPSSTGSATFFPKWNEADITAERWNADAAKGKDKQKWPFEDPLGLTPLPPSLEDAPARWHRASGAITTHMVAPSRFRRVPAFRVLAKSDELWLRKKRMKFAERTEEPWVSLEHGNEHLLVSPLMREIIAALSVLQRPPTGNEAHTKRPWDLIYPRGKENAPSVNSAGGKYAVKLFWLGHWRKVLVDDIVPMDEEGRLLLPRSSENELWPVIISKALLRLAALSFDLRAGAPEAGQFSVVAALTGWYPILYRLSPMASDVQRAGTIARVGALCTYSRLSQERQDLVPDPKQRADEKRGRRSRTASNASSRVPSGRASMADATATADQQREEQLENWFVTAAVNRDKNVNTDTGLDPSSSHEVRILACHELLLPGEDECRYIFELTSPIKWSEGSLGYSQETEDKGDISDSGGWTRSLCVALGVNLERLRAEQAELMRLHNEGKPHPHFHFFMPAEEFFCTFSTIHVYHKGHRYNTQLVLQHVRGQGVSLQQRTGADEPTAITEFDAMELRNHERWLLQVDATTSSTLLLNLCVGPSKPPVPSVPLSSSTTTRALQRSVTELDSVPEDAAADREPTPKGTRSQAGSRMNTMSGIDLSSLASRGGTLSNKSLELPVFTSRPTSALDATTSFEPGSARSGPQDGSVLMHPFQWDAVNTDDDPVVYLRTASTQSAFCTLPAGRHLLAVTIQHPYACGLSILSNQSITLSTASVVLPLLEQPSCNMQALADTADEIVQATLKASDLSKAKQAVEKLVKLLFRRLKIAPAETWPSFAQCLAAAIQTHGPNLWKKHGEHVEALLSLLRQWIEGVSLPKPSVPGGGLAPPMLMVQEYSQPNLLANVSLRPDGTVRVRRADEGDTAPLQSLGSAIADASAKSDDGEEVSQGRAGSDGNRGGEHDTPTHDKAASARGRTAGGGQASERGSVESAGTASNAGSGSTGTKTPQQRPGATEAGDGAAKSTHASRPATEGQPQRQHTISVSDDAAEDVKSNGTRSGAPSVTRSSDDQEQDFAAEEYSEEELEYRTRAALALQAFARGMFSRKRVREMKLERQRLQLEAGATVWDALAEQNKSTAMIIDAAKRFTREPTCPSQLLEHPFTRDAEMGLNVLVASGDAEMSHEQPVELLFQKRLTVDAVCYVRFKLLVDTEGPEVPPSAFDGALPISPGLRILDCATGRLLPFVGEQTLPVRLQPTQQGYILLGWCASSSYGGPVRWKLRALAKDPLPRDLVSDLKPPTCTDEHTATVLKGTRRYPLLLHAYSKTHPIHLNMSMKNIPEGRLVVTINYDGTRLLREVVKSTSFAPLVLPRLDEADMEGDEETSQPDPTEAEPKGKQSKSARKKRSGNNARPETRATQQSSPKRMLEIVCELIDVPDDIGEEPMSSAKPRRRKSATVRTMTSGPSFTLRAICMSKIEFAVDTREQDELKQMVLGWEAAEPGRAEKAQALREELRESVNTEAAREVVPTPSERHLLVLDEDLLTKREREKQQHVREFKAHRQRVAERRNKEAAERDVIKTRTINQANDRLKHNQHERERAGKLRQMYRKKILDKLEAARKAEEERLRLEREAQEAEAAAAKSAKKKKGKK